MKTEEQELLDFLEQCGEKLDGIIERMEAEHARFTKLVEERRRETDLEVVFF